MAFVHFADPRLPRLGDDADGSLRRLRGPGIPAIGAPAELLERARALWPRLIERSARADRERCIPDETVAEMQAAGLFRVPCNQNAGAAWRLGLGSVLRRADDVGRRRHVDGVDLRRTRRRAVGRRAARRPRGGRRVVRRFVDARRALARAGRSSARPSKAASGSAAGGATPAAARTRTGCFSARSSTRRGRGGAARGVARDARAARRLSHRGYVVHVRAKGNGQQRHRRRRRLRPALPHAEHGWRTSPAPDPAKP